MSLKEEIKSFFIPHYDGLTLFVMSFTCLLLILSNVISSWDTLEFSASESSLGTVTLGLLFFAGLFLSIFQAFSKRQKSLIEKKFMLFFAVIINAFSGIWAGTYVVLNAKGWISVFPILNIVNGWVLLNRFEYGAIDERSIQDENPRVIEVALGALISCIVVFVCHFVLAINWAATFSICVVYATNVNGPVQSLILKERIKAA